jgi:hypothetical protein
MVPITKSTMLPTSSKIAVVDREAVSSADDAIANIILKKRNTMPKNKRMATAITPRIVLKFTIIVDAGSANLTLL